MQPKPVAGSAVIDQSHAALDPMPPSSTIACIGSSPPHQAAVDASIKTKNDRCGHIGIGLQLVQLKKRGRA